MNLKNYDEIKTAFDEVLCYSQNLSKVNTDFIFQKWLENKKFFIEHWGALVYEIGEVSFELDDIKKKELFENFLDFLNYTMGNQSMAHFVQTQGVEGFFQNAVQEDYEVSKDKTIPKGMKLMKALKFFENDLQALDYIQNKGSSIIQENCVHGTLCFSVHPLDYLSVSENPYHWRSCHALDGDYRMGNLGYMMDRSTIICYLRGADGIKLERFPDNVLWNGKKWRCLMHFAADPYNAIFAGRQYPFTAPKALEIIQPKLLQSLGMNLRHWTNWYNDCYQSHIFTDGSLMDLNAKHIPIKNRVSAITDIVIDAENSHHYNDLLYSTCYTNPYYCWNKADWDDIKVPVGYNVPCVCCGSEAVYENDTMICEKCWSEEEDSIETPVLECACCGEFYGENYLYWLEGEEVWVCPHCYETEYKQCQECGYDVRAEDIVWYAEEGKFICPSCAEEKGIRLNNG